MTPAINRVCGSDGEGRGIRQSESPNPDWHAGATSTGPWERMVVRLPCVRGEEKELTRTMSGLFTTATLRALAASEPWDVLERLGNVEHLMSARSSLGSVFDQAYDTLTMMHRSEYVFKNTLVSKKIFGHHRPTTASAAIEFPVGKSVADVMVLNGTITAYEIKTDFDSFVRLPTQLADYGAIAEQVYVVTSSRRASTAVDVTPNHVGVLALTAKGSLSVQRHATSSQEFLSHRALFRALRVAERRELLRGLGRAPSDASTSAMHTAFCAVPIPELYPVVTTMLKRRFADSAMAADNPTAPRSLRALICGTELSQSARSRLFSRLSQRPAALLQSA